MPSLGGGGSYGGSDVSGGAGGTTGGYGSSSDGGSSLSLNYGYNASRAIDNILGTNTSGLSEKERQAYAQYASSRAAQRRAAAALEDDTSSSVEKDANVQYDSNGNVWGVNPRTGEWEQWGTRSLLGGTMTTAKGYQAGMNIGSTGELDLSSAGLSSASHPGYEAYQAAHRATRQSAIDKATTEANQVYNDIGSFMEQQVSAGNMTVDEVKQAYDALRSMDYDSLPDAVKSNADLDTLQTALEGTGSYDTGYNDVLAVALNKMGLPVTLRTPLEMKEKTEETPTAAETAFENVTDKYALPVAADIAAHTVGQELVGGTIGPAVTGALGDIALSSALSPASALSTTLDYVDAANMHEIEVALGLTPARDWSTLPEELGDSTGSTFADTVSASATTSPVSSTTSTEDATTRAQRWSILQKLNAAEDTASDLSNVYWGLSSLLPSNYLSLLY